MAKASIQLAEVQRRLAVIQSLCMYARAGVRLKMGDSAKLFRAEEDLSAAFDALERLRLEIRGGAVDETSTMTVLLGQTAAHRYETGARRTPRTS